MANYSQLKAAIDAAIKTNGNKEITGAVLQTVLDNMVNVIGANYTFAGVATPSTNPSTPDQNVVYMASEAGTYTNFGGVVLPAGIHLLTWNGSWSTQTFFMVDEESAPNSHNLVESGGVYNVKRMSLHNTADISEQTILTPYESDEGYRCRPNSTTGLAELVSFTHTTVKKYNVSGGKIYNISGKYRSYISTYLYIWVDANGMATNGEIKGVNGQVDEWDDITIEAPEGATELWMNADTYYLDDSTLVSVGDTIKSRDLLKAISETISTPLTPYETDDGYRSRPNSITGLAELVSNSGFTVRKYNVVGGNNYTFSGKYGELVNLYVFIWVDANGIATNGEYKGTEGEDVWENIPIVAPIGATELWMNVQNLNADKFNLDSIGTEVIDFVELKQQVQQNTEDIVELSDRMNSLTNSLMKVVITGNEAAEDTPFYVRSRYNDEKDIIITHRINQNLLITFKETYIGANTLTDEQLITNDYLVSTHTDSTSPLRDYTQYWHLFAQHGYPVPYFANSIGMTSEDVGALWKDQLNREYHIGKVTAEYVWLLPVIYQDANGHYTRDWHSKNTSMAITSLTYVSGGSYTSPITLSTYSQEQLRPIMRVENRTYVIDGVEVSDAGTYYCNEFCVNETETGYDPATISDWFGSEDGTPNLTGALKQVVFTYSYNYHGAQCSVNTTVHFLREAKGNYGGTQQQFFYDNGDYKAMFMIPKAAARDGVEIDKPFNSPSSSSTSYSINRTAAHLKDVDDPVDRQIGMLHNPNDNTYLVGLASGLSLVVGDTVKTRRNQICLVNSLLLNFSPSNINKFYVSGINTSAFESGYYPAGYFKEVDYYVSYFDPAENVGQVYWYKDGSKYVIYCHCQSIQNVLAINVPTFMDGLKLSVVEKTDNTELLSDTIANGKFFVNYNTADANYIVLIAE